MNFKIDGWVRHSKFGDGQILEDRGDKIKVQFVASGERLMLKEAITSAGVPPSPGFKFGKQKGLGISKRSAPTPVGQVDL
jgi:hypothetical protein